MYIKLKWKKYTFFFFFLKLIVSKFIVSVFFEKNSHYFRTRPTFML